MNKFSEFFVKGRRNHVGSIEATIVGRDWPDVNLLDDLIKHSWCLEQKILSLSSIFSHIETT
jgi:hypothetical protein